MEEELLYLLLNVIFKKSTIKNFTRKNIPFNKIIEYTYTAIELGYVVNIDDRTILTEKGVDTLKKLDLKYKKINKNEWIEEEINSKIPQLDINFVYLPYQGNLNLD